jgi:hypothetical protein
MITEADVKQYMTSLSNWGRWGSDDRLGTLNLITDDVRVAAASLVRSGRALSLSRNIDPDAPDALGSGIALVQRFTGLHEVADHFDGNALRFDASARRWPTPRPSPNPLRPVFMGRCWPRHCVGTKRSD